MQFFLELQYLVDDFLGHFFRIINVYQCFLPKIYYYLMKWIWNSHMKITFCWLDTVYIVFS